MHIHVYVYIHKYVWKYAQSEIRHQPCYMSGAKRQRLIGCLIIIRHVLQKSPIKSGFFAERDLQFKVHMYLCYYVGLVLRRVMLKKRVYVYVRKVKICQCTHTCMCMCTVIKIFGVRLFAYTRYVSFSDV